MRVHDISSFRSFLSISPGLRIQHKLAYVSIPPILQLVSTKGDVVAVAHTLYHYLVRALVQMLFQYADVNAGCELLQRGSARTRLYVRSSVPHFLPRRADIPLNIDLST